MLNIFTTGISILAALVLASALLMVFMHLRPVVVVSGSMEPVIHTGSLLLIDTTYKDVKERDIIAFEANDIIAVHRAMAITDKGYVTKGDANEKADPGEVDRDALMGRAVMWVPWIGYAVRFIVSLPGATFVTAMCIGFLLLYSALGKEVRSHDRKKDSNSFDSHTA